MSSDLEKSHQVFWKLKFWNCLPGENFLKIQFSGLKIFVIEFFSTNTRDKRFEQKQKDRTGIFIANRHTYICMYASFALPATTIQGNLK
jgi:hypothetical protein